MKPEQDLAVATAALLRSLPRADRDEAARVLLSQFADNLVRLRPSLSAAELERRKREHQDAVERILRGDA